MTVVMIPLMLPVDDQKTQSANDLIAPSHKNHRDLASGQGVISQKTCGHFSLSEQPGKHIGIPAAVKHATVKQTTAAIFTITTGITTGPLKESLKGLEIDPSLTYLTSFVSDCVSFASASLGQTEIPLLSLGETP